MVSARTIISYLDPPAGTKKVLVDKQTVSDIKKYILSLHAQYADQYDRIYQFFVGATPYDTCRNIWRFLRSNVINEVESKNLQTLRSPRVLLETGQTMGADCKNYALFTAGVLDAINRAGVQYIPFVFRFATYRNYNFEKNRYDINHHVFIVAFPGTTDDIWIDAIDDVPYFNYRRAPYSYTDKKVPTMALVHMSGFGRPQDPNRFIVGLMRERAGLIRAGQLTPGDDLDREYKEAMSCMGVIGWDDAALQLLPGIFDMFSKKPNPQDWTGWSFGDAKHWTVTDGDSVQNEALNIISYIGAHGLDGMLQDGFGVPKVTVQQIASKLQRGGYINEANKLLQLNNTSGQSGSNPFPGGAGTPGTGSEISPLLLIGGGLVAAKLLKVF